MNYKIKEVFWGKELGKLSKKGFYLLKSLLWEVLNFE